VNGILTMPSRSNLTSSPNSIFVPHLSHPSILAQPSKSVPLTEASTTRSTKVPCVQFAAFVRSGRTGAD
jgi:hypothetical protein